MMAQHAPLRAVPARRLEWAFDGQPVAVRADVLQMSVAEWRGRPELQDATWQVIPAQAEGHLILIRAALVPQSPQP